MAKSKLISRIGAAALAAVVACTSLISASAASIADATIDTSKTANLTLYKYDFTNAAKDGVWNEGSYVSTGQYDQRVNDTLGAATRKNGDTTSDLGNGQTSNGYAIKGVEYTYLKVAEIKQFTESANDGQTYDHGTLEIAVCGDRLKNNRRNSVQKDILFEERGGSYT